MIRHSHPADTIRVIEDHHERVRPGDALETLKRQAGELLDSEQKPVVVYDLDGTLFDNRPRVTRILADLLASERGGQLPEPVRDTVAAIEPENLRYKLRDTLLAHGIEDIELLDWFDEGWFERFFTDEYVLYDHPMPGAVDFVNELDEAGVTTVYLTGRDTPGMRAGTEQSIIEHGFPVPDGETVILITKPTFEQSDIDYKREAIDQIRQIGTVLAIFDNEPKPMNILARAFPQAAAYFLDTLHSPDLEPLESHIRIIPDFGQA